MQKKILLFVVCITMTGITVNAQTKKHVPAPPSPPAAPAAPTAPTEMVAELPPPPPPPPVPPVPPAPPTNDEERYSSSNEIVIVNSNGYEISVHRVKETPTVFVEKNGVTQKIKLSTWNANRKYYEKRYGQLPPPPPPPPLPPVIESDVKESNMQ